MYNGLKCAQAQSECPCASPRAEEFYTTFRSPAVCCWKAPEISSGVLRGSLMVCDTFEDLTADSHWGKTLSDLPRGRKGVLHLSELCEGGQLAQ